MKVFKYFKLHFFVITDFQLLIEMKMEITKMNFDC